MAITVTVITGGVSREVTGESLTKIAAAEFGIRIQLSPVVARRDTRNLWEVLDHTGRAVARIQMPDA